MEVSYEHHIHADPDFPLIFHLDTCRENTPPGIPHWHENMEFLFFVQGTGRVYIDATAVKVSEGQLAVVNSGSLHHIAAQTPACQYYCLIMDKLFCDNAGIFVSEISFSSLVDDDGVRARFENLIGEMTQNAAYYKTAVKAACMELLVYLARRYGTRVSGLDKILTPGAPAKKLAMVKEAVAYLRLHYREPVSIDNVCSHIGFSKYYFCHVFREITGRTAVSYLNDLRCAYAKSLLAAGYNVGETALLSGFQSASYFSKIYRKFTGALPSHSSGGGSGRGLTDNGLTGNGPTDNALANNGLADNGFADNALANNGLADNALADNALTDNGLTDNALANNALADNGLTDNGLADNGLADNSPTDNGLADNALADNSPTDNGLTDNGLTDNGLADNALADNSPTDNGLTDNGLTDNGFAGNGEK